jgi:ribosome-associated protein
MDSLAVTPGINIPFGEFEFTFARSGGPGGQNVNKVNSKAVLRWKIMSSAAVPADVRARFCHKFPSRITLEGEVVISSQKHRDQSANVEDCCEKLRQLLLAVAHRPVVRIETRPTLASKRRRVEGKRQVSQKKDGRRVPVQLD